MQQRTATVTNQRMRGRRRRQYHFTINTQTSNLPGQHWVGVTVWPEQAASYIFDPLGLPPPTLLIKALRKHLQVRHIAYNQRQIQPLNSLLCGPLVLSHIALLES